MLRLLSGSNVNDESDHKKSFVSSIVAKAYLQGYVCSILSSSIKIPSMSHCPVRRVPVKILPVMLVFSFQLIGDQYFDRLHYEIFGRILKHFLSGWVYEDDVSFTA